jgi:poly-gamma-glutamate synthase PgsB/CapB
MNWVLGITIAACAFLFLEAVLLRKAAHSIPFRIVVTGTRGKSSLVKTLLAGIRTVEPATWGKITGDVPAVLAPDGMARVLNRRGPAHLREQAKFLFSCRRQNARCVVVESMAISPEAMGAEMRLLQPTLVVVANVRDDHRETLGGDRDRQRATYLSSLTRNCRWLTLDAGLLAFAGQSKLHTAPEIGPTTDLVFAESENIGVGSETLSTATATLEALGWNTGPARRAMTAAAAEAVTPPRTVLFLGQEITLLDAFSANDTLSLNRMWTEWRRNIGDDSNWSVLLNTRADRPLRTGQFCQWLSARGDVDEIYVTGSHSSTAVRLLRRQNRRVTRLPAGTPTAVSGNGDSIVATGKRRVVVGVGNVRGLGLRLRAATGGGEG